MRGCVLAGVWGAGKTSVYQRTIARLVSDGCQSLITMPQAATLTTHTYTTGDSHEQAAGIRSWLESLTAFLDAPVYRLPLPRHALLTIEHRLAALGLEIDRQKRNHERRHAITGAEPGSQEDHLEFRWLQLEQLAGTDVRPGALKSALLTTGDDRTPFWHGWKG